MGKGRAYGLGLIDRYTGLIFNKQNITLSGTATKGSSFFMKGEKYMNVPIIETEGFQGSREVRLDARFLKKNKVFLLGEITADSAVELTQKLIFLENEPSAERIKLYINSPGGEITSGLLIYDVLQAMTKEVDLYCLGMAASMAAVLLASGKRGHRHILPHSRTMIHEPLIGNSIGGSATSIRHLSESIMDTKRLVNDILARHVGKTPEEIDKATAFDNYMNAEESIAFGICDDITTNIF